MEKLSRSVPTPTSKVNNTLRTHTSSMGSSLTDALASFTSSMMTVCDHVAVYTVSILSGANSSVWTITVLYASSLPLPPSCSGVCGTTTMGLSTRLSHQGKINSLWGGSSRRIALHNPLFLFPLPLW